MDLELPGGWHMWLENLPLRMYVNPRICLGTLATAEPVPVGNSLTSAAQYTKRLWRVQDGLPEDTVQALTESTDGYLWVGTSGGVARFDGSEFMALSSQSTPKLPATSIFCLLVARDGSLWLGSEGEGLLHYEHGELRSFGIAQGLSDRFVRSLLQDEMGRIWIGTDNGLFRLDAPEAAEVRVERIDTPKFMRPIAVHAIAEDRERNIWVGGSRLVRIGRDGVQEETLPGAYSENRVKSILQTTDGVMWVGTIGGLDRWRDGRFVKAPAVSGTVRTLRQTHDGTLWIGTIGHGLWTYRADRFAPIIVSDLLPSHTVLSVYEDRSRQIWIGTQDGLVRLSSTPARVLPLPGGSDADFGTISPDGENGLWVVSSGVFHVQNGIARSYSFSQLGSTPVRTVFRDRAGELWIGSDGSGAFHLVHGRLVHYAAPHELTNNFIRAFMQGRQGDIWIATDEGVSHLTSKGIRKYSMHDGLAYFSVRCLLEDRNGDVWIGTDQGLSRWHAGRFVHDTITNELKNEKVWALLEDAQGTLWIGTRDRGLLRYRAGSLARFTTAQGLASNSIYAILNDGLGRLWLSGPNTLSSASLRQLDDSLSTSDIRLNVTTYDMPYEADGTQFYGGRQPSGCVDANGRIWFPSSKGPIYVDPSEVPAAHGAAPPMLFRKPTVDGRMVSIANNTLTLPAHASRLEFTYAPLLIRSQKGTRFRYRLEGFDKRWTYAGEVRTASYTNLPAGRYLFRVQAYPVNDPAVVSEASITVFKEPYYYQTYWFAALVPLLCAGTAWLIYHVRIRGLRLRFEAVLGERNRLAREMHDTVIQGCTSISALLEAIASRRSPTADDPEQILLSHAREQARTTIQEAREAVWNLRRGEESEHDLMESLQTLAASTSSEFRIPVHCRSEGKTIHVHGSVLHELMMTVREAIYNAALHASPQNIAIETIFTPRQFRILITDDGVGFNPRQVLSTEHKHYGLIGMQERIKRLGGTLRLHSFPGQGTEIDITLRFASTKITNFRETK